MFYALPSSRLFAVVLVAGCAWAATSARGEDNLEMLEQRAFQAAVERVAPSVARIETLGGREEVGGTPLAPGATTGCVVSPDGFIISSAFGFLHRPDSILVQLADGARKPARLVATDHSRLLVLLKIEVEKPLPVAEMTARKDARVGQWTIAVGRTFEENRPNVAVGILSAANRIWGKAIQTDAAASPNNYGGPLVDLRGRVLGVLTPLSPTPGDVIGGLEWYDSGIGFAVPADDILAALPRLKQGEDLRPGLLGIGLPPGDASIAEPILVGRHPNSPAAKAGIQAGDRIVEIDGRAVTRAAEIKEALGRRYAGESVDLVTLRGDTRAKHHLALVAELPPYERPMLGVLPMRNQPRQASRGVIVRWVYPESGAAKAGIQPGDAIAAINGSAVDNADALRHRVSERQPGETVSLSIRRATETLQRDVPLGRIPEDIPAEAIPAARDAAAPSDGVKTSTGKIAITLPEMDGEAWAFVPEKYTPSVPHGLVVWLRVSAPGDDAPLLESWKEACRQSDLILLSPKPWIAGTWTPGEDLAVARLVEHVMDGYQVDRNRVVAHGRERGGAAALLTVFRHPEWFRAAAVIDASMVARPPAADPAQPLAFYFATDGKSPQAENVRQTVSLLREKKHPVTVEKIEGPPGQLTVEQLERLVRWIDTLDRI